MSFLRYHDCMFRALFILLSLSVALSAAPPAEWRGSPILDRIITEAIQENRIPGAVLIVGHNGRTLHRKAYGNRSLVPRREPMTVDTIFDCASLTKVIATTSPSCCCSRKERSGSTIASPNTCRGLPAAT